MSKRPLNSLKWMPVAEAHRLLTVLLGNGYLAAKDLTDAVTAKRSDKRLPCMQRAIASRIAPDQDREIVPLLFRFDSEKLQVWEWRDDVPVVPVPADVAPVYLGPADAAPVFRPAWAYVDAADAAFFVWRPQFEKIWPELAASAAPHSASSARDDEPTPATTARTDDKPQRRKPGPKIRQNWRLFVAVHVDKIKKKDGRTPSAGELAQLCEDKIGYQPDESDIQKLLRILLNE